MRNFYYTKPQATKFSTVWELGFGDKGVILHYGTFQGAEEALATKLQKAA